MGTWLQRMGALISGHGQHTPVPVATALERRPTVSAPANPTPTALAARAAEPSHAWRLPFFEWLLDTGPLDESPLHDSERRLLAQLDTAVANDATRSSLLPRAPTVVPALLNSLRDESQSAASLAQRVTRDPQLVAEVLRMANGAQTRGDTAVLDIADAIQRLGTNGLRRAIARVLLKPIFDGRGDSLSARCASRLWLHSEAKANACQREAAARGLDPFEGYLTGLMHNIGWTATLRAIDRSDAGAARTRYSEAFAHAIEPRRESFFALLVMSWQLSDALTRLAVELIDTDIGSVTTPLGHALNAADEQASLEMLDAGSALGPIDLSKLAH